MGQNNEKQQKPMEEKKDGNQSLVRIAFRKLKHKKTRHRRLPLEMECEIFKFLKLEIQPKLICGMGRGIYGIYGQKVLIKSKRLQNPNENVLYRPKTKTKISADGLKANNIHQNKWHYVFAKKGFAVSGVHSRPDNYPGTILYYFEVKLIQMSAYNNWSFYYGFSDGNISYGNGTWIRCFLNSYACSTIWRWFFRAGVKHELEFKWPHGTIKSKGDVCGCGLVLNSDNKLSIFFTGNGLLLGRKITINHSVADFRLYPTVHMRNCLLKFNFGGDKAKPFKYDIGKCPGLFQ